ncbi:MAG: DUF91 domain-containing protein [Candidatus Brockarchaeota archaeon]|nr:DUF91 domain-containing protein [Candidatus Brockarchaeota archaeon]
MPKLQQVQISERELEDIICSDPEYLEEGMVFLERQFPTDSGLLDVLMVDSDGALVVVELKNKESDEQILQALRYYDYVATNISDIVNHFQRRGITINDQEEPRLILVAPVFSQNLIRICKYLDVEVVLKAYKAVKLPSGEIELILSNVDIGERDKLRIYLSLEEKLNLIQNEEAKKLAQRFVEELKEMKLELRMVHDEWISIWHKGKKLATMGCKRKFFVIETETSEGWKRFRVESVNDLNRMMSILKEKM